MRVLIVEDDFISSHILTDILSKYGDCDTAVDGNQAVQAVTRALEENKPYELICMDIMMPGMDGQEALLRLRQIETERGVHPSEQAKVIMISALGDPKNVLKATYKGGATSYLVKPINKDQLLNEVRNLGLIP